MSKNFVRFSVAFAAAMLCFALVAYAAHTTFGYPFESFTLTGNGLGTVTDDFEDGILTWTNVDPVTSVAVGTIDERGGKLHLESPGTDGTFPLWPTILFDSSHAFAPSQYDVTDGNGSFVIETILTVHPALPAGFAVLALDYRIIDIDLEEKKERLACAILHTDEVSAAAISSEFGVTYMAGVNLVMTRVILPDDRSDLEFADHEVINVAEIAITGNIYCEMSFVDSTNAVTARISIDGGSSYMTFAAITSQLSALSVGNFVLLGDPMTVNISVPLPGWFMPIGVLMMLMTGIYVSRTTRAPLLLHRG